ncbi:MAG: BolA/IbaG family iron-sulfur metabolism protein [Methylophilales bacterium]|nr:BolA/IbaG family iron-sulfur metabolism protein [Methylophilales bacterium]
MLSAEQLKTYIMNGLTCEHVEVRGDDGTHFEAVVVSAEFVGKNMVQQHQLVYKALGDRMREEIHALSLRTFMPSQWNS